MPGTGQALTKAPQLFEVTIEAAGTAVRFQTPSNARFVAIRVRDLPAGRRVRWNSDGPEGEDADISAPYSELPAGSGWASSDARSFSVDGGSLSDLWFSDGGGGAPSAESPTVVELVLQ